uniref:Uncharacterized protein n=1 Tax=Glossina austeni TaxID=7395 RepID=A0A1A9V5H7_GLOAU
MRCPLGNHQVEDPVHITELELIIFIKKGFPVFRPQNEVCKKCKNGVMSMFNLKKRRLRKKISTIKKQIRDTNTVSSLDDRSEDSFDRLVGSKYATLNSIRYQLRKENESQSSKQTERSRSKSSSGRHSSGWATESMGNTIASKTPSPVITKEKNNNTRTSQQPTNGVEAAHRATAAKRRSVLVVENPRHLDIFSPTVYCEQPKELVVSTSNKSPIQVRTSQEPTTSVEVRRTFQNTAKPGHVTASSTSGDDDDDEMYISLNVLKESRLPNIQPIPKRKPFDHPDKNVMDIYLQGLHGAQLCRWAFSKFGVAFMIKHVQQVLIQARSFIYSQMLPNSGSH